MELLAEISDGSLGIDHTFEQMCTHYELRKSARAILLNLENEMALQHVRTYSFHKLPGGGLRTGETVQNALDREVLEEVGCKSHLMHPVGCVIEYRNKFKQIHISYCFVARVDGAIGIPKLDQKEIEEEQTTLWLAPELALDKIKKGAPKNYVGCFIQKREATFLETYLRQFIHVGQG